MIKWILPAGNLKLSCGHGFICQPACATRVEAHNFSDWSKPGTANLRTVLIPFTRQECAFFSYHWFLKGKEKMKTGHKIAIVGACIVAAGTVIAPQLIDSKGDKKESQTNVGRDDQSGDGDGNRCQGTCSYGNTPIPENTYRTDTAPDIKGPWAYKIVRTVTQAGDEGLMVRSCNVSDCPGPDGARQVGLVLVHRTVWVECWEDSGFDGHEGQGITKWYKVKWPTNEPHKVADLESARDDKYSGWMYSGYMESAGHDGNIPECK